MKKRSQPLPNLEPDSLDTNLTEAITAQLGARTSVDAETRARIFQQIEQQIGFANDHQFFAAHGGDWRILAERVYLKVLMRDDVSGQATYLVRYSPGTSFPVHPQRSSEECMLIAGDLRIGDIDMRPGDLQIAVPGIEHGPLVSQHGALVFVRGLLSRVPEQRAPDFSVLPS